MNKNIAIVTVMNTRNGMTGTLRGIWWNVFAGCYIVNARVNGLTASWFAADCAVL